MKIFVVTLTVIILSFATPSPCYAVDGKHTAEAVAHNGPVVHVTVNGLVCDFCARALEKVFRKQEPVSDIKVDLDSKIITINLKKGQMMDDKTITDLVIDSGYNVKDIKHVK